MATATVTSGALALELRSGDDTGQGDHRTDRQVDATGQDNDRLGNRSQSDR